MGLNFWSMLIFPIAVIPLSSIVTVQKLAVTLIYGLASLGMQSVFFFSGYFPDLHFCFDVLQFHYNVFRFGFLFVPFGVLWDLSED